MVGSFWGAGSVAVVAQTDSSFSLTATILEEVERKAGMKTLKGEVRCGRSCKSNCALEQLEPAESAEWGESRD